MSMVLRRWQYEARTLQKDTSVDGNEDGAVEVTLWRRDLFKDRIATRGL